jgi:hypothetical protein
LDAIDVAVVALLYPPRRTPPPPPVYPRKFLVQPRDQPRRLPVHTTAAGRRLRRRTGNPGFDRLPPYGYQIRYCSTAN